MARIRTIKPDFWTDEKVVELSPWGRLLFIGLWNFVDDEGRMPFSPKKLKMLIFPADTVDMSEILGEIRREKLITIYTVDDVEYLQVNNFNKHQKVDKRSASKCPPAPEENRGIPPNPAEFPPSPPTEWNGMEKEKELSTTLSAHESENGEPEKQGEPRIEGIPDIPESRHQWTVLFQRFGYDLTAIRNNVNIMLAFDDWCKWRVPRQILIDFYHAAVERKGGLPGSMNYFIPGVKQYVSDRDNPRPERKQTQRRNQQTTVKGLSPHGDYEKRDYAADATDLDALDWYRNAERQENENR